MDFQQGPAGQWQINGDQDWTGEIGYPSPDMRDMRSVPYMSQNNGNGNNIPQTASPPTGGGTMPTRMAPTGTASTGMMSTGMAPTRMAPTRMAPTGMASTGMMPTGMMPTGMMPTGMMSTGMMPTGMMSTGMVPTGMTPTGMAPSRVQGSPLGTLQERAVMQEVPLGAMRGMVPGPMQEMDLGMTPETADMERPASSGGGLRMSHNLPPEVVETPISGEEVYRGSLKALLARNLGHYVVATFLIGTQEPVSWEGFLHGVGNDYIVIYQPDHNRYISGDLYSLKFVEFNGTKGAVPVNPGYRRRDGQRIW